MNDSQGNDRLSRLHSRCLVQLVSRDGRLCYVNGRWRDILDWSRDDALKLNALDVVRPDQRRAWQDLVERLPDDGSTIPVETCFIARDGMEVPVTGELCALTETGQSKIVLGVFHAAGSQVLEDTQLRKLFDMALDMLCVASLDGYFKQVNPAFEAVLGYSREELLRHSFLEFVVEEDREKTYAQLERMQQGHAVIDFQNRYRAKDGSIRWLSWRSAAAPEEGRAYAVARDVTEQKRVEEMLLSQADQLARSNAALDEFASVASHDLRAPLRAIKSLSEWICEDLGEDCPSEVEAHLEKLTVQVRRMESLTDDLLEFARTGWKSTISRIDTGQLLRELELFLAPPAGFAIVAGSTMPVVETAKTPLELVLRNLVENAIKHHDRPSGTVTVTALDRGDQYQFNVEDDGPGIPSRFQQHVFKMFQRISRDPAANDSGIGLALVKRIVEDAGGRVWVESQGSRGSTFSFTWPKHGSLQGDGQSENPARR